MKDTPLSISTESTPEAIVIHVCGDVTSQGSVQVEEVVAAHLQGPGVPVVINLSKTTYMNSTALSVLVKLNARAKSIGRQLRLEDPSPNLVRMLELTNLLGGH
ncbi:MAG: anti-sigma factor antagonist [Proteobacteria bacterium]|jgi:anti-anti-sigma factor|nr:anti-sigma factor antagonist [Pseudomonadota bacterium]